MDIGFYIADLLRHKDEVTLPGLGTFSKKKVTGFYHPASNSFHPPSYQVDFSDKNFENNILSEYISSKKTLSSSSAEYFVKKFASGISELLESSGEADLAPLGILRQQKKSLTFEPSSKLELGGEFYGLKPITDLSRPASQGAEDLVLPEAKRAPVDDFITPQRTEDFQEDEEFTPVPRRNPTLLIILGTLLFAIVAAALFYLFNPKAKNLIEGLFAKSRATAPAISDSSNSVRHSPIVLPDSSITATPPLSQDSTNLDTAVTPLPEPATTTIEIIGAAFKKRSEADRYVEVMNKKGLKARILNDMPGTLFKVSLASFADFESAKEELYRIRQDIEPQAWTTPYKPKKTL